MKTAKPGQQPALEKEKNGWWIAALINTIAIALISTFVVIFGDSLKGASIQAFALISYSVGGLNAILILHIHKKRNQKSEQAVYAQPSGESQKEETT